MRDFYPEDFRRREALFGVWREVSALHGFEGYDAPVVETQELLTRKAGEEIVEQIYAFSDKSGRGLALRPEMTPSLARMIIARQGALAFPLKWWTIAQCFRYERMTRGRKREHYQWNLDVVGEESVMAEAEVIGAAVEALRRLGLRDDEFRVRVGSRALLAALFQRIGIGPEHFLPTCLALDKRGKISDAATRELLEGEGLDLPAIDRVFELLALRTIDEAAERVGPDGERAVEELRELFALAGGFGFAEPLVFDVAIVRGLGYYSGIVFEAYDAAGRFRAIFGGGRYDNLLKDLGGQRCPCVGLGFGDVVIFEVLEALDRLPSTAAPPPLALGYMTPACRALAIRAAATLRKAGYPVDLGGTAEKPKKFFARANRVGSEWGLYVGPEEAERGCVALKNMRSGEQQSLPLEALPGPLGSLVPRP